MFLPDSFSRGGGSLFAVLLVVSFGHFSGYVLISGLG